VSLYVLRHSSTNTNTTYGTCETCKPTSEHNKLATSFKQAGISISPDGAEDTKFHVHGLPDITVWPWLMEDTTNTLDSDGGVVVDGADPDPST